MKDRRLTIFAFVAGAVLLGLLTAGPPTAMAQTATDPHIYVCPTCIAAPSSPTLLNPAGFNVGVSGGTNGNITLQQPLLIIVGTFDGAAAPTVSFGTSTISNGDTVNGGAGGWGWNGSEGVLFNTNNLYATLGLTPGGGASDSFSNYQGFDTSNGLGTPSSFSLYVYEVPVNLSSVSPIMLDLNGATTGSFVVGYSCEQSPQLGATFTSGTKCSNGEIGFTPFTTTGFVDVPPAPEASAVTLMSLVLLAFGALVLRARRSQLT
jgi:hypothetical protein